MPQAVEHARPADTAPHAGRPFVRALGNLLLGVAIGLASYYAITDIEGRASQVEVRTELAELGTVADSKPPIVASAPTFDFEGWATQDSAFWQTATAGGVLGRLVIERMGLDTVVLKNTDRETLKRGPGWIPSTAVPGETGNCAISGHRTTYHAPFRKLDLLRDGDTIELYTPFRRYVYRVVHKFAVRPWRVDVLSSTQKPTLTLTACHPPYSARYRLIVQAELVEARPLEGAPSVTP